MKIKVKGMWDDYALCLGVQTNKGGVENEVQKMAKGWAPAKAQSYTIERLIHTDYHGNQASEETGYATIMVAYYTTKTEGKHLLEG